MYAEIQYVDWGITRKVRQNATGVTRTVAIEEDDRWHRIWRQSNIETVEP